MNPFIRRLAHEAAAPLEDMLSRLIRVAALLGLAAGFAVAASAFLTVDLFLFLQEQYGSLIAASVIAGCYLVLALVFLLLALKRPKPAATADLPVATSPVLAAASVGAASIGPGAPPVNAELAANIDAAVVPVLKVLRDAGLDKEVLAIEAGAEVAKQLNPFVLVAFALGAGMFVGRTVKTPATLF